MAPPHWSDLTPAQQNALAPLAQSWNTLGETHRRKWILLSQNFAALPTAEKEKLYARMGEWASLSAQQRNQARQNFAATARLDPGNKKAQWEAYQALSDEEKQRLAAKAYRPKGAAPAFRPATDQKLAIVPVSRGNPANPPKIVLSAKHGSEKAVPATLHADDAPVLAPAAAIASPEAVAIPAAAAASPTEPSSTE